MSLGPFDLTGGPFLALYGVILVLAGLASLLIPSWLRPEGRPGRLDGEDELACLAGGATRLADAAVVRLIERDALAMQGRSQLIATPFARANTPVERAILCAARPAKWTAVLRAVAVEAGSIERRLAAKGLMLDQSEKLRMRLLGTLPLALALGFGAVKLEVGLSRDKPVGFLVALLLVTAVLAALRFATVGRLTREGSRMLMRERENSERLRRAPVREEMGASVALFGTAVLAGSALTDFHRMRRQGSGESGGTSSDGGSDGGGGCGGGGCGGCGGS